MLSTFFRFNFHHLGQKMKFFLTEMYGDVRRCTDGVAASFLRGFLEFVLYIQYYAYEKMKGNIEYFFVESKM